MPRKIDSESPTGCFQWVASLGKSIDQRWARAKNALLKRLCRDKTGVSVPTPNHLVNDTGTRDLVFTKKPVPQRQTRESASLPPSPTPSRRSTSSADVNAFVQTAINNDMSSLVGQDPKLSTTDFARQYAEGIIKQARVMVEKEVQAETSMTSSILDDMAQAVVTVSLTNIVAEQRASMCQIQADDSITSSVASELAEAAVKDSLTNIMAATESQSSNIVPDQKEINETASISSSMVSELAEATVRVSLTNIMAGNHNESAKPKRKWIRTANEYIDMLEIAPFPDKSDSLTRVD